MFKVYVGNLDARTTLEHLKPLFEPFGPAVDEIVLANDAEGKPRGFAIVLFKDPQLGQLAIETLTNKKVLGRTLQVNEAVKKGKRTKAADGAITPRNSPLGPRAFQRPGAGGGFSRPGAGGFGGRGPMGGRGGSAGGGRFIRNPRRMFGQTEGGVASPAAAPGATPAPGGAASAPGAGSRPLGSAAPGAPASPAGEMPTAGTSRPLGSGTSRPLGSPGAPPVPGGGQTQSRMIGGAGRPMASGSGVRPAPMAPRPLGTASPVRPATPSSPVVPPTTPSAAAPGATGAAGEEQPKPKAKAKAKAAPATPEGTPASEATPAPAARPRAAKKAAPKKAD